MRAVLLCFLFIMDTVGIKIFDLRKFPVSNIKKKIYIFVITYEAIRSISENII